MKENKILALDPSKTATGWVVFDLAHHRVVDTGCFKASMKKSEKKRFNRKTDIKQVEQRKFAKFLYDLFVKYGFNKVVTEYPHGSQSATASWALSMVNATVQSFCFYVMMDIPVTYLESDCKMSHFGTSKNITKSQTAERMYQIYESMGYKPEMKSNGKPVKYKHHAVCDALMVLNTYLKDKD